MCKDGDKRPRCEILIITISVAYGQILDYKQLLSNTRIGDPSKTGSSDHTHNHCCVGTLLSRL